MILYIIHLLLFTIFKRLSYDSIQQLAVSTAAVRLCLAPVVEAVAVAMVRARTTAAFVVESVMLWKW